MFDAILADVDVPAAILAAFTAAMVACACWAVAKALTDDFPIR